MNQHEFSDNLSRLRSSLQDTPTKPGVYIMRDEAGRVIYVGKAKNLKNRINSYFSGTKDVKTRTLLNHARSIETILVTNEYEALLLENTLIKQHSPKYNINLKDGKTYPVVRISADEFPRVFRTRHIVQDGSQYFGPFPNIPAVDTMLELIDKLFPLRKCRRMKKRSTPCMYYHIGRCSAPCCGKISKEEYAKHVEKVKKLLSGETEALLEDLTEQMKQASEKLLYERASQLRNAIISIRELSSANSVVDFDPDDRDYLSWASEGVLATFTVFSMRGGRMTGRELYRTRSASKDEESLQIFMTSYYSPDRPPPPKIYVGTSEFSSQELLQYFQEQFDTIPQFRTPDEKRHEAILAMAYQNAKEDLRRRIKERGAGPALDELRQLLSLRARPQRIEGFDIAQLDGAHPVASLISFKDGVPDRKNYRYFKLKTVEGIVDDFAAMREVVARRYSRLATEGKELPDLILIDGGIGQVNAAQEVLQALGIDCDVIGLAKREEELWKPDASQPIRLDRRSEALRILQHVRDETHRFATGLNQRLRSKDLELPALQSVTGIGPIKAGALLEAFGSLEGIVAASEKDLALHCHLDATTAAAVHRAAEEALEKHRAEKTRLIHGGGRKKGAGYKDVSSYEAGASLAAEALDDPDHAGK